MSHEHHVVIVGGGFAGLAAAKALRRAPVRVTLVDRRNFHLFQPLLYQVATGALSPANISAPLRAVLGRQTNTRVLLADVRNIDPGGRRVVLDEDELAYDTLIVAAGSRHHYFGNQGWEPLAPGLKTVEDATEIRRRVLLAFERAERERNRSPARLRASLTFVVVGGGPTGVELAGALAEIARHTLRGDFRAIDPTTAQIVLVEAGDRILPDYPERLSARARDTLSRLGVKVATECMVTGIERERVVVRRREREIRIPAHTVLWAAGNKGSPLGRVLAARAGAELDSAGRVVVGADLSLPTHPEILVLGDMANCTGRDGKPLPGIAPVAVQQGTYAAKLIRARLTGRARAPFRYRDLGTMATIGRAAAVADIGPLHFSGLPAWLAWLFVHLMKLVAFENRLLVLLQWMWSYLTWNRSARLITGTSAFSTDDE
jgi:NADH:quinone reductase (non-electrogenic)